MPIEQLRREKIRSVVMAGFELIIGVLFIALGWQFFSVGGFFSVMTSQITGYSGYLFDLYKAIQTGFFVGGFIAVFHGIKRITDNILNAWVKSALPTEEK